MSEDDEYIKALEIQRRNFEAQFGSIEDMGFEDKSKTQVELKMKTNVQAKIHQTNHREKTKKIRNLMKSILILMKRNGLLGNDEEQDDIPKPKVFKLNDSSNTPLPVVSKQDRKLLKSGRAPTLLEISKRKTRCQTTVQTTIC